MTDGPSNSIRRAREKKARAASTTEIPVCRYCGKTFHAKRADAAFCSTACKTAAARARRGAPSVTDKSVSATPMADSVFSEGEAFEIIDTGDTLNGGSSDFKVSAKAYRFRRVDEVTVELLELPFGHGDETKHVAWLLDVGRSNWWVRYRDKAVGPLSIHKAQRAALALAQERYEKPVRQVDDPIVWLNGVAAFAYRKPLAGEGDAT